MAELSPVDFDDFSGGMADIGSSVPNTVERLENMDVTTLGTLKQRPGSGLLDDTASLISVVQAAGRSTALINYEDDLHLLIASAGKVYGKNGLPSWTSGGAWSKLSGPNGSSFDMLPALKALTARVVVTQASWEGHQIVAGYDPSNGSYISPQKFFLTTSEESSQLTARNAWLPKPMDPGGVVCYSSVLARAIRLANAIKSKLNTHFADTTSHVSAETTISTADATTETTLITLTIALKAAYNDHVDFSGGFGKTEHGITQLESEDTEPFGYSTSKLTACLNYVIPESSPPVNAFDCVRILNQLVWAINLHFVAFMAPDDTVTGAIFPVSGQAVTWDLGADTATFTGAASFRTGDPIQFFGGTLPTGLTAGTAYYAIDNATDNVIKIASSVANARAGTAIDLTGVPAGTSYAIKSYTNLHPAVTTPLIPSSAAFNEYCYPEGFSMNSGAGYPHINSDLTTIATSLALKTYQHFRKFDVDGSTQIHANANTVGYMNDEQVLINGTALATNFTCTYDWQVFAAIIKCYEAFRVHRKEAANAVHTGSTDTAGSALSTNKSGYTTKYMPSPFDKTTWEMVWALLEDFLPKLTTHAAYVGATRHNNAQTITYTIPDLQFTQRRLALTFVTQHKTYRRLDFEARSAPAYTDSYAFCETGGGADGFDSYTFRVSFSGLQALVPNISVPAIENYDSDQIYLEVYRTLDGGTVFYRSNVLKDPENVTLITDYVDDEALESVAYELYTTGGVVGRDEPPRCRTLARNGDYIAFGAIVEEDVPTISTTATLTDDTVNYTSHGLSTGAAVVLWGIISGDITADTLKNGKIYYATDVTTHTFKLAASQAAAEAGTEITFDVVTAPLSVYVATQNLLELPYRIRQSFPAIGFSSPEDFFVDVDSDVIQVATAGENWVAVCKQGVYRIEGRFDEQGRGGMIAKRISERVQGVSALGGVTVGDLFFFIARDGFYVTDGYKVVPLTAHLKDRHQDIVTRDLSTVSAKDYSVQCAYDAFENRIHWTLDPDSAGWPTNNWVLHLNASDDTRGSMSEWHNSGHFRPSAIGYFRGNLIRGDKDGYVFKHDESYKSDPKITGAPAAVSTTHTAHVPFKVRTQPTNFGFEGLRKWVARCLLKFRNNGDLTAALKSVNDENTSNPSSMTAIRFRQEHTGQIKQKRTFPAGSSGTGYQGLRCHSKQVQMEPNSSAILYASSDYATGTRAGGVLTFTSASFTIPSGGLVGMNLYIATDSYATAYPITAASKAGNDVSITATGVPNGTAVAWLIKGAPRNELVELEAISLYAGKLEIQPVPPSGDSGGN